MRAVEASVAKGTAAVQVMQSEVSHQAALQSLQLANVSEQGRLNAQKLDIMLRDIAAMGNDPNNTPAGRALMAKIEGDRRGAEESIQALTDAIGSLTKMVEQTNRSVQDLASWRTSVEAVINLAKWMGFGNLAMFVYILLKSYGIVP